jgi:hypothetical protein
MEQIWIRLSNGLMLLAEHLKIHEKVKLHTHYTIEDFDAKTGKLVKHQEFDYNCLLKEGITALLNLLIGAAETAFNNSNTYIGVGDNDTPADANQTGLQAAVNKLWKGMDATYPTITDQTVTFRSTFLETEANFAWKEATIVNASTDAGDNLNRKVQAMGEKTNAVSRVITVAVTFE